MGGGFGFGLAPLALRAREVRVEFLEDLIAGALDVDAEGFEDPGGHALPFAEESEQDVFRADIRMIEGLCLLAGEGEDLLHARGVGNVPDHLGFRAGSDLFFDLHADAFEIEPEFLEDVDGHALAELDQAQEQMLGADVVVVEPVGFLACEREDLLGAWGEIIHGCSPREIRCRIQANQ